MKFFSLNRPGSITIVYLILGLGWIFLSDRITDLLFSNDIKQLSRFQLYKGSFYVIATSLILYFLIRRLYRAVNLRNQEMELLFSNPDLGLIRLDGDFKFLEVTSNFEKATGYFAQDLLGKPIFQFIPDQLIETSVKDFQKIKSSPSTKSFIFYLPFLAKNGNLLFFNLYGIQVPDKEKNFIAAVQNITKEELALQKLEAKNQQLIELASDQSHLVRAPLARILAISDLIDQKHHLNEEEKEFLIGKIKISAEELDMQIRKISLKMNS